MEIFFTNIIGMEIKRHTHERWRPKGGEQE